MVLLKIKKSRTCCSSMQKMKKLLLTMVLSQVISLYSGAAETEEDGRTFISLGLPNQVALKSHVVKVISDRGVSGVSVEMSFRVLLNSKLMHKENKRFWRPFRQVCEAGLRTIRAMSSLGIKIYYTPEAPLDNFSSCVLKMLKGGKVAVTQDTYDKTKDVTNLLQDVQSGRVKLEPPPKPKATAIALRRSSTPVSLKKTGIVQVISPLVEGCQTKQTGGFSPLLREGAKYDPAPKVKESVSIPVTLPLEKEPSSQQKETVNRSLAAKAQINQAFKIAGYTEDSTIKDALFQGVNGRFDASANEAVLDEVQEIVEKAEAAAEGKADFDGFMQEKASYYKSPVWFVRKYRKIFFKKAVSKHSSFFTEENYLGTSQRAVIDCLLSLMRLSVPRVVLQQEKEVPSCLWLNLVMQWPIKERFDAVATVARFFLKQPIFLQVYDLISSVYEISSPLELKNLPQFNAASENASEKLTSMGWFEAEDTHLVDAAVVQWVQVAKDILNAQGSQEESTQALVEETKNLLRAFAGVGANLKSFFPFLRATYTRKFLSLEGAILQQASTNDFASVEPLELEAKKKLSCESKAEQLRKRKALAAVVKNGFDLTLLTVDVPKRLSADEAKSIFLDYVIA